MDNQFNYLLPVAQFLGKPRRDHNGQGYSTWLDDGGFKGGTIYRETDEVSQRAAVDKGTANDYQASLLHQFVLKHKQLNSRTGVAPRNSQIITMLG